MMNEELLAASIHDFLHVHFELFMYILVYTKVNRGLSILIYLCLIS
jgi:hypothetical protein